MSQHSSVSETNAGRRRDSKRGSYDTVYSEARASSSKHSGQPSKSTSLSPGSRSSSQASPCGPTRQQQRKLAANDSASHRYRRETTSPTPPPTSGSLGPGAEPPVAIASRAFAHEERTTRATSTSLNVSDSQGTVEALGCDSLGRATGSRGDGEVAAVDVDCSRVEGLCARNMGLDEHAMLHSRARDRTDFSTPERENQSEEDETLPDSFNLSDEAGPEGAPTGRGGGGDDRNEHRFIARMNKRDSGTGGGVGYSSDSSGGRCSTESDTMYGRRNQQNAGRRHDDITSDGLSSSPSRRSHSNSRQQQQRWGRISRRRPFVETRKHKTSRIAPLEIDKDPVAESEGGRRRHGQIKGGRYESPPRRASSTCNLDHHSGRSISRQRQRQRRRERAVSTEVESIAGDALELDRFEREVARLRRENSVLKRQQHKSSRYSRHRTFSTRTIGKCSSERCCGQTY